MCSKFCGLCLYLRAVVSFSTVRNVGGVYFLVLLEEHDVLLMEMSSTFLVHMDAGLSDVSLLPGKVSDMCCTFLLW